MMTMLIHSVALLATLAILAYMALLLRSLYMRQSQLGKFYANENVLFKARIDLMSTPTAQAIHTPKTGAWSGFRKFQVVRKVMENCDSCSFYLEPHDGRELPGFLPGQYLTFKLKVPGKGKDVTRCYSLSDSPNPKYYRVTIKRVPYPNGREDLPPGVSSNFFHDQVKEGDILDVKAPSGHFHLDVESHSPVVLVGAGIGVTPMLSMLNYMITSPIKREIHFFYSVRDGAQHIHKELLKKIASENPNVRLNVCYSNPEASDEKGRDFEYGERVTVELFKRVLQVNNFDFYVCGPKGLMEAIAQDLEGWGVPESKIHYETFGPSTVKKAAKSDAAFVAEGPALEIKFAHSNRTVSWTGETSSLLELAEANDIKIDSGCRAGNCGTCVTTVLSGEVVYPGGKPDFDVEKGCCLACVAAPKPGTTLSLDA